MTEHSVEPWEERCVERAIRATTCVNFLQGVSTETLTRLIADNQRDVSCSALAEIRLNIQEWVDCNPHIFGDDGSWKEGEQAGG